MWASPIFLFCQCLFFSDEIEEKIDCRLNVSFYFPNRTSDIRIFTFASVCDTVQVILKVAPRCAIIAHFFSFVNPFFQNRKNRSHRLGSLDFCITEWLFFLRSYAKALPHR